MSQSKVIIVTGASAGIGKAAVKRLLADGHVVYGAARRGEKMRDLEELGGHVIGMDITDEAQVSAAVSRVLEEQGRIDVLVNNAGYGLYGAVEQVPIEDARYQFEVNLFGLASLTQKVLPGMRERGSGLIINVSSVGGKIYTPLGAWYHATKHALEGWSDALRVETAQFGIHVSIIEPGAIQTEFTDVMNEPMLKLSEGGPYQGLAEGIVRGAEKYQNDSPNSRPEVIANVIADAVSSSSPKTRYAAGKMAGTVLWARRWLSDKMFDRMISSMLK